MSAPTPKTALDLVSAALRELRVLRTEGDTLAAADRVVGEEAWTGLHAELQVQGRMPWLLDSIPLIAFRPLVVMLAAELASTYGKAAPDLKKANVRLDAVIAKRWDGTQEPRLYY